ncbi:hypothetical protein [Streptomyces stackebrandtii]|uniref:hypothetical protein n=1 Tax=Streptomyces stackebrandtii TaxID=3051177 RepID=UPI0028DB60FA|nr:hypothetical protein [Streptomyces sp. DSM 40976]
MAPAGQVVGGVAAIGLGLCVMYDEGAVRAGLLERLRASAGDRGRKVLLTGATVVTMDPASGVLDKGDVLIEGDRIAAVGADLGAQGAESGAVVIDATGCIVAPGFVDTHRHAWEAQLRRIMPDVDDLAG